jgi:hypothetical protein
MDDEIVIGSVYKYNKTGNLYKVTCSYCIDCTTNSPTKGESLVIYTALETGRVFARTRENFLVNFTLEVK